MSRNQINAKWNLSQRDLTQQVRIVLANEPKTIERVEQLVSEHLAARKPCRFCMGKAEPGCPNCHGEGSEALGIHRLSRLLRDYVEELVGVPILENGPGVFFHRLTLEVLRTALYWVEWDRLAEGYVEAHLVTQ